MNGRILGVVALMLVVGAAGGYAVAAQDETDDDLPSSIASAAPIPADDPSYPVIEYELKPDPTSPPLKPGLPLRRAEFQSDGLKMSAPVPKGWRRVDIVGPEWNFSVAENPPNTYLLRVGILGGSRVDVRVAVGSRISALRASEEDGHLENLDVEQLTETGFVVTYIQDGYQRVVIERFLPKPGSDDTTVFATVALTGRVVDREGMKSLSGRVVAELLAD